MRRVRIRGNRRSRANGSLHAEKGRASLWKLRPELAQPLAPAREYRFGEIIFIKPVASVIGLKKLRDLRARTRDPGREAVTAIVCVPHARPAPQQLSRVLVCR